MAGFQVEQSPIGRIVVAPSVPRRYAVFYTTIDFSGRITDEVAQTLTAMIRDRFGIDASLTTCYQVHSATVQRAQPGKLWRECDACDALWTTDDHVALGIKVADCLPVTMIDPANSVMANVHSGWRGTVQRITAEALDAVQRSAGFDPTSGFAWLGPSIRGCCFEVGEEVVEQFSQAFADAERYIDRSQAKPHIDIAALTVDMLHQRGFPEDRIFDSQICTRCEGSIFHSHRRGPKGGGRNLAFAAH